MPREMNSKLITYSKKDAPLPLDGSQFLRASVCDIPSDSDDYAEPGRATTLHGDGPSQRRGPRHGQGKNPPVSDSGPARTTSVRQEAKKGDLACRKRNKVKEVTSPSHRQQNKRREPRNMARRSTARHLPVNELVLVSKLPECDDEETSSPATPDILIQDPISDRQTSDDHDRILHARQGPASRLTVPSSARHRQRLRHSLGRGQKRLFVRHVGSRKPDSPFRPGDGFDQRERQLWRVPKRRMQDASAVLRSLELAFGPLPEVIFPAFTPKLQTHSSTAVSPSEQKLLQLPLAIGSAVSPGREMPWISLHERIMAQLASVRAPAREPSASREQQSSHDSEQYRHE